MKNERVMSVMQQRDSAIKSGVEASTAPASSPIAVPNTFRPSQIVPHSMNSPIAKDGSRADVSVAPPASVSLSATNQ